MPRPTPPPPARPRRGLVPVAAIAATLALAFGAGRWSAPSAEPSAPPQVPQPMLEARSPEPLAAYSPPPAPAAVAAPAPVAAATPAAPHPPGLTPEVANRVNQEAKAQVEAQRERIVSRCWPKGSAASGRPRASVTYNLTFDAQGREIARGIAEDRRAPAGEFAQCLRRLDRTAIAIPPPGTNVGLSFAVSYP